MKKTAINSLGRSDNERSCALMYHTPDGPRRLIMHPNGGVCPREMFGHFVEDLKGGGTAWTRLLHAGGRVHRAIVEHEA